MGRYPSHFQAPAGGHSPFGLMTTCAHFLAPAEGFVLNKMMVKSWTKLFLESKVQEDPSKSKMTPQIQKVPLKYKISGQYLSEHCFQLSGPPKCDHSDLTKTKNLKNLKNQHKKLFFLKQNNCFQKSQKCKKLSKGRQSNRQSLF